MSDLFLSNANSHRDRGQSQAHPHVRGHQWVLWKVWDFCLYGSSLCSRPSLTVVSTDARPGTTQTLKKFVVTPEDGGLVVVAFFLIGIIEFFFNEHILLNKEK